MRSVDVIASVFDEFYAEPVPCFERCLFPMTGRWPEFLSFLERGQSNAWETCPSMASLPEQKKNRTLAVPNLLDELSDKTRENIVQQLRKKVRLIRN